MNDKLWIAIEIFKGDTEEEKGFVVGIFSSYENFESFYANDESFFFLDDEESNEEVRNYQNENSEFVLYKQDIDCQFKLQFTKNA